LLTILSCFKNYWPEREREREREKGFFFLITNQPRGLKREIRVFYYEAVWLLCDA
jgi:hypothetical protein